ncbi:hypothetical protein M0813_19482 [Anaeramoeba flamelloides]|uniref:Uncharacterized protein n=1 Tax=Anaeramoeba flamelloides TaxID=1746091 RepID=A0AAV8A794_9EUKA|nr:hypothetical protein M0812_01104 [Anaeramoeba flamelloides]KAJ6246342.1 hypothetical protein M0813_19482 [Anaeramoeba flamelloides]
MSDLVNNNNEDEDKPLEVSSNRPKHQRNKYKLKPTKKKKKKKRRKKKSDDNEKETTRNIENQGKQQKEEEEKDKLLPQEILEAVSKPKDYDLEDEKEDFDFTRKRTAQVTHLDQDRKELKKKIRSNQKFGIGVAVLDESGKNILATKKNSKKIRKQKTFEKQIFNSGVESILTDTFFAKKYRSVPLNFCTDEKSLKD